MATSGVADLQNLIPEMWAPNFYEELRNNLVIANVFSREYSGVISQVGDKVNVNQVVAPNGEILNNDKNVFNRELMQVNQFSITADKRAVAAFEFTDLAQLQSQRFEQDAREALVYAVQKQIEDDVIAGLIPSASAPDHDIAPASASDLAPADLANIRSLLSKAKVPATNRWFWGNPDYFSDLLLKTQFTSSDFLPSGSPVSSAMFSSPLYGFNIMESDNLPTDTGYAAHPSALQMVMQQELRLKISDLHNQGKFGFVMSADLVYGYTLFDNTRIVKISG